jgi:hypothetical protein
VVYRGRGWKDSECGTPNEPKLPDPQMWKDPQEPLADLLVVGAKITKISDKVEALFSNCKCK